MADLERDPSLQNLSTREADVEAPPGKVVRRGGTFDSFRHRDYTLFWSGALVSNVGTWMQTYALGIVVWGFRRSEFDVGLVNFAAGIPVLFLALWAGSLADRVDRRRLIIDTQWVLLAQAALLGWLYASGHLSSKTPVVSLLWVCGLGVVSGVMSALSFPSWQSILPDLVPRENLLNAIALNSAQFQSARLLGPLVAGALVLAGAGMGEIFYANAASFIFVIAALWAVKPRKTEHAHHVPDESAWSRLTAGVRYAARENHVVGVLIISTAVMTIFGMPYMMLVAPVADKGLGFTGPALARTVSWIMAVNGLGAVFGALIVAGLPASVCRERLMRWTLAAMALCIMGYAASRSLALTLVFSALAGAAVLTTNSLVNTSIQSSVPGHLRGRVMALFVTSFMGLMPVSAFVFGAVGRAIGPTLAIGLAAVVLLLWALLLFARPSWLGLDRPVPAAAEADGGA